MRRAGGPKEFYATYPFAFPSHPKAASPRIPSRFSAACGIEIYKPNPRQYEATIPSIPGLTVLFQRPTDIVISVRNGSVDFGITGLDVLEEHRGENGDILVLHEALGFGKCALALAVPESWITVETVDGLRADGSRSLGRPLRVATKFPVLVSRFFAEKNIPILHRQTPKARSKSPPPSATPT